MALYLKSPAIILQRLQSALTVDPIGTAKPSKTKDVALRVFSGIAAAALAIPKGINLSTSYIWKFFDPTTPLPADSPFWKKLILIAVKVSKAIAILTCTPLTVTCMAKALTHYPAKLFDFSYVTLTQGTRYKPQ